MLLFFETLVVLGCFVGSLMWSISSPTSYEPWIGLATSTLGGITLHRQRFNQKKSLSEADKQLFQAFKALFSEKNLIPYYKTNDFLLAFRRSHLDPLYEVNNQWGDEAHNFANEAMQERKRAFYDAAKELTEAVLKYTIPDGRGNVTVIPLKVDQENLPPHIREEAKAIDAKVPAFIQAHEELMKIGNRLT